MRAGGKLITAAMRAFLLWVDPRTGSHWAFDATHGHSTRTKRACASRGWVTWSDNETWPQIYLTEEGKGIRQLVEEIYVLERTIERMKESGILELVAPIVKLAEIQARAPLQSPRRRISPKPEMTCGTTNHDFFAEFIASLNELGKNRWKDPRYTGEGPVRVANPTGPGAKS